MAKPSSADLRIEFDSEPAKKLDADIDGTEPESLRFLRNRLPADRAILGVDISDRIKAPRGLTTGKLAAEVGFVSLNRIAEIVDGEPTQAQRKRIAAGELDPDAAREENRRRPADPSIAVYLRLIDRFPSLSLIPLVPHPFVVRQILSEAAGRDWQDEEQLLAQRDVALLLGNEASAGYRAETHEVRSPITELLTHALIRKLRALMSEYETLDSEGRIVPATPGDEPPSMRQKSIVHYKQLRRRFYELYRDEIVRKEAQLRGVDLFKDGKWNLPEASPRPKETTKGAKTKPKPKK